MLERMVILLRIIVTSVAVWLTTLLPLDLVVEGGDDSTWKRLLVFLAVGALLVAVNALVRPIVRVVTFPLWLLTLGLFGLVVNWAMLWLVAWLSERIDFVTVEIGGFWKTLLAAAVISLLTLILAAITGAKRR